MHADIYAIYETGVVRTVPAVDWIFPDEVHWDAFYNPAALARAILAHLVGLDLPPRIWRAFQADMVDELIADAGGHWQLPVEEILGWLEASR